MYATDREIELVSHISAHAIRSEAQRGDGTPCLIMAGYGKLDMRLSGW